MSTRYFIAIDPAIAVVEQLMIIQDELERALEGALPARWIHPEQLHITLSFLGALDPALLDHLREAVLRLVRPLFPFQVQHIGLAVRPDESRPRHLFAPLDPKGDEVIGLLQRALERELDQVGLSADTRTRAPGMHIGRLSGALSPEALEIFRRHQSTRFGTSTIRNLALMSAELGQDGPLYRVLDRFPLGI